MATPLWERAGSGTVDILTPSGLRAAVGDLAGIDAVDVGDDDDLVGLGIDSIAVMRLANHLRVAGVEIAVSELIEAPTLAAWRKMVESRSGRDLIPLPQQVPIDEGTPFPLATMQHAYWVGRMGDHPLSVASHFYCEFDGRDLDPTRLEAAIRALTVRHPMLRARVGDDGWQQVLGESPWPGLTVHDLRAQTSAAADDRLAVIRQNESKRRLDVGAGEVFDIAVSLRPDGTSRLHVNVDMLVADALSFRICLDELAHLYADLTASLPALSIDFPGYLAATREARTTASEADRAYWQERIGALGNPPQLPLAVEPEDLIEARPTRRELWLSEAEHQCLREICKAHGVTLSMALLTAFSEVLARWSSEPRFVLNLPLFDRRAVHPDVPGLVGDFTNLLLLTVDVTSGRPFAEAVRATQERFRADVAHTGYSGMEVLRDLARAQPGAVPSAPVVFTSALGMGDLFSRSCRNQFGELAWMISQTAQVWLDHQVTEESGRVLLNWDAVDQLFPTGVLDAMFTAYTGAIRWMAEGGWHEALPIALPAAQTAVRRRVNQTETPTRSGALHDDFVEHARRHPEAVAVAWGDDDTLSYGELAARANRLADRLQGLGLQPGEPVGITVAKGPAQVEAVVGTLMAGGAYVPVDVDLPSRRRDRIYTASGLRFVIGDEGHPPGGITPVALEGQQGHRDAAPPPPSSRGARSDDLAYIIFTSGSTGEPKGVMVSHGAALNTIEDINRRCRLGPADRLLAVSALGFDLSVYDIFGPLSVGGAVVMIDDAARRDAAQWVDLVGRWGVTIWQSVPTLLDMLLVAAGGRPLTSLRMALVGGDWPGLDLHTRLAVAAPECRLIALGGTTETAIHSTWFEVERVPPHWRSIPWGTPLHNVKCRVVDERNRDCPDWVPGELWIGGASVSLGYRGDQTRTASQFVHHDGLRWYRTGDIARYWPDGTLEFMGRRDHQVKIRGHRIELGEVETALESSPGVDKAVVVGVERHNQKRLGAVVVPRPELGMDIDLGQLESEVAAQLPSYMVPERILPLADLPLSANGKVDRAAIGRLLGEHIDATDVAFEPPEGSVENSIAALWADLLQIGEVGRTRSFFALGGDSLLATRFVQEARQRLGIDVPLRQLLATPTVAGLADAMFPSGSEPVEEGVL